MSDCGPSVLPPPHTQTLFVGLRSDGPRGSKKVPGEILLFDFCTHHKPILHLFAAAHISYRRTAHGQTSVSYHSNRQFDMRSGCRLKMAGCAMIFCNSRHKYWCSRDFRLSLSHVKCSCAIWTESVCPFCIYRRFIELDVSFEMQLNSIGKI